MSCKTSFTNRTKMSWITERNKGPIDSKNMNFLEIRLTKVKIKSGIIGAALKNSRLESIYYSFINLIV